jgi:hypothetical protein
MDFSVEEYHSHDGVFADYLKLKHRKLLSNQVTTPWNAPAFNALLLKKMHYIV